MVLYAEGKLPLPPVSNVQDVEGYFDVIENEAVKEFSGQDNKDQVNEAKASGKMLGRATISQGNINNNHIYLRSFFSAFPKDAVGGSNSTQVASRTITVEWGGQTPVVTDLDGTKMLFRKRGWVREFFNRNGVKSGDIVTVEEVGPYRYRIFVFRE